MGYTIYNWDYCQDKLEALGFITSEGSNFSPNQNQDIWDAAKLIYDNGLNVMIKHGDELDVLFVSKGRFGQK